MVRLLHELAHHPDARNLLGLLRAGHTAAAPPSNVMNERRLMGPLLQVEYGSLAHRSTRMLLCTTAK
jgi:hypothetical protein